ncbi:hypothetical protein DsansV1_C07g0071271 [Dioscorea sansibarensis]
MCHDLAIINEEVGLRGFLAENSLFLWHYKSTPELGCEKGNNKERKHKMVVLSAFGDFL